MTTPFMDAKDPVMGARMEILDAISSLHMPAEPLDKPLSRENYLVFQDKWAAHAHEHLRAALEYLNRIGK